MAIMFRWGVCPTCLKPLVKTDPGTMDFKPCREHLDEPMLRYVCRLCKRQSVDEESPVLGGFAVCQSCLNSHVASVRMVAGSGYLYRENGGTHNAEDAKGLRAHQGHKKHRQPSTHGGAP